MDVRAWLRARGAAAASDAQPVLTHTFLDGGRAFVPDALADDFLEAYARSVVRGARECVAERARGGAPVRMFADIDVSLPEGVDGAAARCILAAVLSACFASAPDALVTPLAGTVVVATSARCGKVGAHLVWPDVVLEDLTVAAALRDAWVAALGAATSPSGPDLPSGLPCWDAVLDRAVYRPSSGGLRMLWAPKGAATTAVYEPAWVVRLDARPPALEEVTRPIPGGWRGAREWLARTRVMVPAPAVVTLRLPPGAAVPVPAVEPHKKRCRAAAGAAPPERRGAAWHAALRALVEASPYRGAPLAAPKALHGGGGATLCIDTSSRWCCRVGREHASSRAFLIVRRLSRTRWRVSQHCHAAGCATRDAAVLGDLVGRAAPPHTSPQLSARQLAMRFLQQRSDGDGDDNVCWHACMLA